jgi:hypothetical protein
MEALDWVYERLTAEGIKLVDQLPDSPAKEVISQDSGGSIQKYRRRARASPRKRRYSCDYESVESSSALCPEEAIDELLFRAETGLLRGEDLLTIIEGCRLSALDVDQLVEYLWSKRIDLPDVKGSQLYNKIISFIITFRKIAGPGIGILYSNITARN